MAIKQLLKRTSGWLYLNSSMGRNQLQGAGVILMLHRVLSNDRTATNCASGRKPSSICWCGCANISIAYR
jgi:hypothetical protein